MDLPELALRRPKALTVCFLVVVLLGLVSLSRLPIDLMPDITYPTLTVSTEYPGVGPEEIETLLTRPVEEGVAAVQGLESITSTSVEGRSQVRLAFSWGQDLDAAAEDVRARLERVRGRLPVDATPPAVLKFDLAAFPVVFLAVSGPADPLALRDLAEDQVKPRIERLPGVAAVEVRGGLTRELRVEVARDRLTGLGLGLDQVVTALGRENQEAPAGEVPLGERRIGVRVRGAFSSPEELAQVPVAWREGRPVRVDAVAVVRDTHPDVRQIVRVDGRPALQLVVRKQAGANTVAVADAVVAALGPMNAELRGARVDLTLDTARQIRGAIAHLWRDLLVGAGLATAVLLLFLRSWRSTAIVALAIPISIVATFGLLYARGLSLNTMTLGGLALGLGRLLDDAIVVIENIYRRRALGEEPAQAALLGTRQVSLAIVASTATTLAVFVPLVFLSGYSGVLFTQLALVVGFSLACSLVVAQGLVPMLAGRAAPEEAPARSGLARRAGTLLAAFEAAYARWLDAALANGRRVVAASAVTLVLAGLAVPWLDTGYMPAADEGEVRVAIEAPPGTSPVALEALLGRLEGRLRLLVPEVRTMLVEAGGGGWRASGTNTGSIRCILAPRGERARSTEAIAAAVRRGLGSTPGLTTRVAMGSGSRISRIGVAEDSGKLTVQIRGHDRAAARALAVEIQAIMADTPGLLDVEIGREVGQPEALVRVDRERAAAAGVTATGVARGLEAALRGARATLFRARGDEHPVVVRLAEADRQDLSAALTIPVSSALGGTVPLSDVVRIERGEGPARIDREDQARVVEISATLEGAGLGAVVTGLRERLDRLALPPDFAVLVRGDYEAQQEAFRELATALGLALLLVYLVLVAQFESWRHPLVILATVPVAASGVVAALLVTHTAFDVQAFIGLIVLVGVAVGNGIVLVDFMNQLRAEGLPLGEAVVQGARLRWRPVVMTTATTVLAMLPMALGWGEGGELQAPMARVVIGGLLVSTAITLFLIPVVYRWVSGGDSRRGSLSG